jgi:hypothetical protein
MKIAQPRRQSHEIVHIVAGHDDRPAGELCLVPADERDHVDTREPFGNIRRLEFAPVFELGPWQKGGDVRPPQSRQFGVGRKTSVFLDLTDRDVA